MDMKNIQLIEKLMKTNLEEYMRTKDIKYIEFLNENIQELLRLKQTTNKYYDKVFNGTSFFMKAEERCGTSQTGRECRRN